MISCYCLLSLRVIAGFPPGHLLEVVNTIFNDSQQQENKLCTYIQTKESHWTDRAPLSAVLWSSCLSHTRPDFWYWHAHTCTSTVRVYVSDSTETSSKVRSRDPSVSSPWHTRLSHPSPFTLPSVRKSSNQLLIPWSPSGPHFAYSPRDT